jgi:hypothetical protein
MARKYEYGTDQMAWSLEQCEEIVLISAYLEILPFIPATDTWQHEFENHFFVHGNGIATGFVDRINAVRRRKGLNLVEIRETDITDYARAHNKAFKSETRKRFREEMVAASTDERVRRVNRAKSEIELLPPPHHTFKEWKERQAHTTRQNPLSFEEVKRRIVATTMSPQPVVVQSTVPKLRSTEKAVTMLKYATRPEVIRGIIAKLSPDDALKILPEIEGAEIRDELIKYALDHS